MGQMGGGGGGGGEQQYHYQALLAAVHHQTLPFPTQHHLPAPHPHGQGGGGGDDAHAQTPHNAHAHGHAHGHAASQSPPTRGFADWSASTSAFTSLAGHPTAPPPPPAAAAGSANASANGNANPVHYSISPCYAFWTHYMLDKNAYPPMYPPPPPLPMPMTQEDHKDSGSASSFGVDSFAAAPMAPNISAHMPPIQGPVPVKESKKSEGLPRVVKSELETRNRRAELHCETVGAAPESKQAHESCDIKLNSGEYQVILRKELTKSDVGNVGRIVLPKKDAEANLPTLFQRDPVILQMDDMVLPVTWKFKYRYWPNNKSRMYILDSAGEFLKTHGLQAGDALVIYKNSAPGKFIIRGEKAQQATNP